MSVSHRNGSIPKIYLSIIKPDLKKADSAVCVGVFKTFLSIIFSVESNSRIFIDDRNQKL